MKLHRWRGDGHTYDAYVTGDGDGGQTERDTHLWTCAGCEHENDLRDERCAECGQDRPDIEPPEPDDDFND